MRPAAARVRHGLTRTFQINTLFPDLTPIEAVDAGDLRARSRRGTVLAQPRLAQGRDRRSLRDPRPAAPRRGRDAADAHLALRPAAAARDRAGARDAAEGAAARRARRRRSEGRERHALRRHCRACPRTSRCFSSSTTWTSSSASPRASSCWSRAACCSRPTPDVVRSDPRVREVYLGQARSWLSRCSNCATCAPATARRSCSTASRSRLPANGSLAVLGRNGVGKTTLLLTAMGFRQAGARLRLVRRPRHLAVAAAPARPARPRLGPAGARHLPFAHRGGEPHCGRPARPLGPRCGLRACSRG